MSTLFLTTYLTGSPDPQRRAHVAPDDSGRLRLFETARDVGIPCVIFHDQLGERFRRKHTARGARFEQVPTSRQYSCNDYRFFLYRDYLAQGVDADVVFACDLFDVSCRQDPGTLVTGPPKLWIGRQEPNNRVSLDSPRGRLMVPRMEKIYGQVPRACAEQTILSAGIFGGRLADVQWFLEQMCQEIQAVAPREYNCNMPAFNRVAYEQLPPAERWANGEPLHSKYRAFDHNNDRVCLIHK